MPPKCTASRLTGALLAALLIQEPALADVGDVFGFGSRTAGVSGAGGAAWGFDGYGAYANPASVAVRYEGKKLLLSWGLIYMEPSFTAINDVIVENNYTSDEDTAGRLGDVDVDYRPTFGQAIGGSLPLFPDMMNLSLGFMTFMPINQFAFLDTGEPFVPEYALHRSRTNRPQIHLALGARPSERLHVGLGAQLAFSLTSDGFVFLNTTEGKPSTMRFTASIKPKVVPHFGVLYTSVRTPEPGQPAVTARYSPLAEAYEAGDFTVGLVGRLEATYNNVIDLHSSARAFGDFAALDFAFEANAVAYYDPHTIELGGSYLVTRDIRLLGQVEYQLWGMYKKPMIDINEPTIENCEDSTDPGDFCGATPIEISESDNPNFNFRNTIVPRVGAEIALGSRKLRVGYAFHPSILDELPTGKGNLLDPGRHAISAGLGLPLKDFLGLGPAYNVDLHASVQLLEDQTIEKTSGNELGEAGVKIGAPGYDAGGVIYGGGVSLSLAF